MDKGTEGGTIDYMSFYRTIVGFWESAALFAALRIKVFEALEPGPAGVADLAGRLGVEARSLEMLLRGLHSLGLATREGEAWRATPVAEAFLYPSSPRYMGHVIASMADSYAAWGELGQAVRSGRPAVDAEIYLGQDPERTRHFVLGMHNRAMVVLRGLVDQIDLGGIRRLLDVGGGAGSLSILLAQKHPDLTATVLDLPAVAAIASENVKAHGLAERVKVKAADFTAHDLGQGFDAALVSGVLHREDQRGTMALLGKIHGALEPRGRLLVCDVMPDRDRPEPLPALFALHMMLTSDRGGAHDPQTLAGWIEEAGFEGVEVRTFPPPTVETLILAQRRD